MKINPPIQILKSVLSNWLDNQIQLFVEYIVKPIRLIDY